jgi:hypothetical protein
MCFAGGGDSGASAARADQQAQQARSLAARGDVDKTFSQFDDNFYNQRAQAYRDYQTPQLNDQYADAQKQLVYALSRKGNLNSSVAGEQFGGLGKQYATNSDMVESAPKATPPRRGRKSKPIAARSWISSLQQEMPAWHRPKLSIGRARSRKGRLSRRWGCCSPI